MGGATGTLLIVAFAAVVAGVIWLTLYLRKLRRQELAAVAQQLADDFGEFLLARHGVRITRVALRAGGGGTYSSVRGNIRSMVVPSPSVDSSRTKPWLCTTVP